MRGAVEQYVGRSDVALRVLEGERRKDRPPTTEEGRVRNRKADEEREFESGFWCPDLRSSENKGKLREWKGDWGGMNVLAFVRVRRDGSVEGSSWPPR